MCIRDRTYTGKTYDGKAMKPVGTLQVSGDKVPVSELEVTYTGIGDTTYNGTDAPTDAGTYQVTYKVREDNDNYIGEKTYTFTTVSYTHLDVYKRQEVSSTS